MSDNSSFSTLHFENGAPSGRALPYAEPAGGGADSHGDSIPRSTRDDAAGPPRQSEQGRSAKDEVQSGGSAARLVAPLNPHRPVGVKELARALDLNEDSVRKNARSGLYGDPVVEGQHVYDYSRLPERERKAIDRHRRKIERELARAQVSTPDARLRLPEKPLESFDDKDRELGRQRADFCLEVETMLADEPGLTTAEACARINAREIGLARAGKRESLRYPLLMAGGWRCDTLLKERNYLQWSGRWRNYRRGRRDGTHWWILCPDGRGRPSGKRAGDDRFWAKLAALYETETGRDLTDAYDLAARFCRQGGVLDENIPSYDAVWRWYRHHVDPAILAARRMGKKFVYDQLSGWTPRDWSAVEPDECWSSDHHTCNLFVRWWDKMAGPIDENTNLPTGGWRRCRPVLTQWMDAKSWKTVGLFVAREPSRDTIEMALRYAIEWRKGVPQIFYMDCGKDFSATFPGSHKLGYDEERIGSIASAFGVRVIQALPYNPRAKLNENFFRHHEAFMRRWPSYCGRNKPHMDRLWSVRSGSDNLTLKERVAIYPEGHKMAGCLVRPEAVPTIEEFEAGYRRWLAEVWDQRVMKGRVNFGMSPDHRYLRTTTKVRAVTEAEVSLAFLRVYASGQKTTWRVARGGILHWCRPGGSKPDWRFYQDAALLGHVGTHVQVRVDLRFDPPQVFAFERTARTVGGHEMETWQPIACAGPMGSVPPLTGMAAFTATPELHREAGRTQARLRRAIRAGADAEQRLAAQREIERDLGITTQPRRAGLQPDGKTYVLVPQTARKKTEIEAQKFLDETVTADDLKKYDGAVGS